MQGRSDVPLNDAGRREADGLARALASEPLDRALVSPLSRARETAEAIAAGHGLAVTVDETFIDIDYGEWTEYWDTEARRKFGDQYRQWKESPHLYACSRFLDRCLLGGLLGRGDLLGRLLVLVRCRERGGNRAE